MIVPPGSDVIHGEVVEGFDGWVYEDFLSRGKEVLAIQESSQWELGDLACGVEAKYKEDRLGQFARDLGVNAKTLMNYRAIARAYPRSSRRRELSFSVAGELVGETDRLELAQQGMTKAQARALVTQRKKERKAAVEAADDSFVQSCGVPSQDVTTDMTDDDEYPVSCSGSEDPTPGIKFVRKYLSNMIEMPMRPSDKDKLKKMLVQMLKKLEES